MEWGGVGWSGMGWGGVGWGGVGWGGVGWRLGARAQREWDEDAKYLMMNEAPVLAQLRMERSQREALLPPARPPTRGSATRSPRPALWQKASLRRAAARPTYCSQLVRIDEDAHTMQPTPAACVAQPGG